MALDYARSRLRQVMSNFQVKENMLSTAVYSDQGCDI